MKQVVRRVIDNKGSVQVEEVPIPKIGTYDVLIDVRFSAISSGTEMSTLNKTLPELVRQTLADPWMRQAVKNVMASGGVLGTADRVHDELIAYRLIGYSGAGVVLEVGSGVAGISVGDEVAFSGQGHAEVVRASRNQVVPIPRGVRLEDASFATVGAIALQGVRRAQVQLGETVAVVGLGLIGQLAFQLAQAAGARCIGIEPNPARRELARTLGIHELVEPGGAEAVGRVLQLTGGMGADRVLICASGDNPAIANDALKMCRAQGRVTVLGIVPMELERMPFFRRELDFVFSRAYGPGPFDVDWESGRREYPEQYVRWDAKRNMQAFLGQVEAGRVKVEPLITGTFPVQRAQAAYDAVYAGASMASLLAYEPFEGDLARARRVDTKSSLWIRPLKRSAVQVGLIGCGNFTRSVLLPELNLVRAAKIHAIAAQTGVNAKPMAEKYGAKYITTDDDELLADKEIDAVIIATRHHLHAALAKKALEAGKHVLVEKPMAMTAAEAVAIHDRATASGLHLVVGHNRRYAPLTRRLLASRPAGPAMMHYTVNIKPLPAEHWTLNPTEGGGRLLGESDHFVDMLNLFSASAPESVAAVVLRQGDQETHASCDFTVVIHYENGSCGTLLYTDLGHASFPRERLEVFCGGAVLRLEDYGRAELLGGKGWREKGKVRMGHAEELANFVEAILGKAEPIGRASDGLSATLVVQAAMTALGSPGGMIPVCADGRATGGDD
ncbi:MAG: bi-domain-containing oxidoreductase [Deltaproteobacteria bacterium]|nr:bi-domain-containing oxidoreductase [Deltaproteobacteria bacterium]